MRKKRRKLRMKAVRNLFAVLLIIIALMVLGISFLSTKNNNLGYEKLEIEISDFNKLVSNNLLKSDELKTKYKTDITKDLTLEKSIEKYLLDLSDTITKYNDIRYSTELKKSLTIKNIYSANSYYRNIRKNLNEIKDELNSIITDNYYSGDNKEEYNRLKKLVNTTDIIKDIDNTLDNITFNEKILDFLSNNKFKDEDKIVFNSESVYNSFKDLMKEKKGEYFIEMFEYDYDVVREYYTEVIRNQNTVIVYEIVNGTKDKIVKVFPCSVGKDNGTPTGTFKTSDKYVWRALFGNVYGQYATRINGSILFHSVPYTSQSKDSLEWDEFNKLGTAASMGCVRMTVKDVKWIYDNCPTGMTVKIYDGDLPDGVEKPTAPKIDESSPNKGWDPTDPDSNNPWNK